MKKITSIIALVLLAFLYASCIQAKAEIKKTFMSNYRVVSSTNITSFNSAVNSYLAEGYVAIGGVSVSNNTYYQAVAEP